jgi:hypothetical protein
MVKCGFEELREKALMVEQRWARRGRDGGGPSGPEWTEEKKKQKLCGNYSPRLASQLRFSLKQ